MTEYLHPTAASSTGWANCDGPDPEQTVIDRRFSGIGRPAESFELSQDDIAVMDRDHGELVAAVSDGIARGVIKVWKHDGGVMHGGATIEFPADPSPKITTLGDAAADRARRMDDPNLYPSDAAAPGWRFDIGVGLGGITVNVADLPDFTAYRFAPPPLIVPPPLGLIVPPEL